MVSPSPVHPCSSYDLLGIGAILLFEGKLLEGQRVCGLAHLCVPVVDLRFYDDMLAVTICCHNRHGPEWPRAGHFEASTTEIYASH